MNGEQVQSSYPNHKPMRMLFSGLRCRLSDEVIRRVAKNIYTGWLDNGIRPDHVAVNVPHASRKWGRPAKKLHYLNDDCESHIYGIAFSQLQEAGRSPGRRSMQYPDYDWSAYFAIAARWEEVLFGTTISDKPAIDMVNSERQFLAAADQLSSEYGFCRPYDPFMEPAIHESTSHEWITELRVNATEWRSGCSHLFQRALDSQGISLRVAKVHAKRLSIVDTTLLRDVYLINYLNDRQLEAPFGHTSKSLKEWIQGSAQDRGALERVSPRLTAWRVPASRLNNIREAVFRGGRLFYYLFLRRPPASGGQWLRDLGLDERDYFRPDPTAPWEAPDPIPEIFRADFYKDKDPGLTL